MTNRSRLGAAWVAAAGLSLGLGPAAPADPESGAVQSIEGFHAALLDVMGHATELGYGGRAAKLAPVIPRHFDVAFMAQRSVGLYWKRATQDERARFLEAFLRFLVANYAGQFDDWTGQSFETLGEEPAPMGTRIVRTRLIDPGAENVDLNYRVHLTEAGWKIVDIYLDGTVSELALRRSEFSGIVERESFDALILALDEKIAVLAGGSS
jgi:phospholipid transport system substrate-binding protein